MANLHLRYTAPSHISHYELVQAILTALRNIGLKGVELAFDPPTTEPRSERERQQIAADRARNIADAGRWNHE